ncbi:MAG: hypothetical protein E6Q93_20515 [Burkholderiaceae bacterium]|nr:MAG: hypothetical protein E6Q93_20515 [Burkholderiaceae bacterium]
MEGGAGGRVTRRFAQVRLEPTADLDEQQPVTKHHQCVQDLIGHRGLLHNHRRTSNSDQTRQRPQLPNQAVGGGSGFDSPRRRSRHETLGPLLAGGLRPDNVAEAIHRTRQWGRRRRDRCRGIRWTQGLRRRRLFVTNERRAGLDVTQSRRFPTRTHERRRRPTDAHRNPRRRALAARVVRMLYRSPRTPQARS